MTQAPAPPCQRFVDYLADPQIATTQEILAHVQSCPACLMEMVHQEEASQDLFHDAKYEWELNLARKLYLRASGSIGPNVEVQPTVPGHLQFWKKEADFEF